MIFSKPTVTKTQHGTAMALRNGLGEKKKKRGERRSPACVREKKHKRKRERGGKEKEREK
jgi:hypothetical protein